MGKKSQDPAGKNETIDALGVMGLVTPALEHLSVFRNVEKAGMHMSMAAQKNLVPLLRNVADTIDRVVDKHVRQSMSGKEAAATRGVGKPAQQQQQQEQKTGGSRMADLKRRLQS